MEQPHFQSKEGSDNHFVPTMRVLNQTGDEVSSRPLVKSDLAKIPDHEAGRGGSYLLKKVSKNPLFSVSLLFRSCFLVGSSNRCACCLTRFIFPAFFFFCFFRVMFTTIGASAILRRSNHFCTISTHQPIRLLWGSFHCKDAR